jgi:hypothetical protein
MKDEGRNKSGGGPPVIFHPSGPGWLCHIISSFILHPFFSGHVAMMTAQARAINNSKSALPN